MFCAVRRLKECPHTVSGRKSPYIPVSRCQCYSHWGWMNGWMNEWMNGLKWKDCCVHPISQFIIFCPCKHFLILFNFLFTLIHKLYLMLFYKWFLTPTFIKISIFCFLFLQCVCLVLVSRPNWSETESHMSKWALYQHGLVFEKCNDDSVFKRPMDYITLMEEKGDIYEHLNGYKKDS